MKVMFAAAVLLAAATLPAAAAELCPGALSNNNPAFGSPRPCPQPADAAKVQSKTKASIPGGNGGAVDVRRENGRTVYSYGNTSVAVGGSVGLDVVSGGGRPAPVLRTP